MEQFQTPLELVAALRSGSRDAEEFLKTDCKELVATLVRAHSKRHPDVRNLQNLEESVLHWITIFLRTRTESQLNWLHDNGDATWAEFHTCLLVATRRLLLWQPEEGHWPSNAPSFKSNSGQGWFLDIGDESTSGGATTHREIFSGSTGLPYRLHMLYQPRDSVGGDWYFVAIEPDGRLWTLVADTPGKSWPAYVMKKAVYCLWQGCLEQNPTTPAAFLDILHERLITCIPDGFFIETCIARFDATGNVRAASAGAGYVVKQTGSSVDFVRLRGPYLGIDYGCSIARNEQSWVLEDGDELMTASDGLSEQPAGSGYLGDKLVDSVTPVGPGTTLHERVIDVLQTTIERKGQHDDVTLLTVERVIDTRSGNDA